MITELTPTILAFCKPQGADISIHPADLPPGNWSLIPANEIEEDEAARHVEGWDSPTGGDDYQDYYKNYHIKSDDDYMNAMDFTNPLGSLRSLVESKGLYIDNPYGVNEPEKYSHKLMGTNQYDDPEPQWVSWQEANSKVVSHYLIKNI